MSLHELYLQAVLELNRNDRLRIGFYFIVALGLFWLVLVLGDANREARTEYQTLIDRVTELTGVGTLEQWESRYAVQEDIEQELQARLWQAASENQILAAVQSTIRKLADDGGINNVSVRLGTPQVVDENTGLMRVRTRVRGNFFADDAMKFIGSTEGFTPLLLIDELSLEIIQGRAPGRNRLNADLVAYYLNPEARRD